MTKSPKPGHEFIALAAPKADFEKRGILKADLYRMQRVIGSTLKAGVTSRGDFVLYSNDTMTQRRLVDILVAFAGFHEQRIDLTRTKIESFQIVDKDEPLFT
jgi:hypothetical protein